MLTRRMGALLSYWLPKLDPEGQLPPANCMTYQDLERCWDQQPDARNLVINSVREHRTQIDIESLLEELLKAAEELLSGEEHGAPSQYAGTILWEVSSLLQQYCTTFENVVAKCVDAVRLHRRSINLKNNGNKVPGSELLHQAQQIGEEITTQIDVLLETTGTAVALCQRSIEQLSHSTVVIIDIDSLWSSRSRKVPLR